MDDKEKQAEAKMQEAWQAYDNLLVEIKILIEQCGGHPLDLNQAKLKLANLTGFQVKIVMGCLNMVAGELHYRRGLEGERRVKDN